MCTIFFCQLFSHFLPFVFLFLSSVHRIGEKGQKNLFCTIRKLTTYSTTVSERKADNYIQYGLANSHTVAPIIIKVSTVQNPILDSWFIAIILYNHSFWIAH